jgi:hypothetical protein
MSEATNDDLIANREWLDPEEFPFTEAEVLQAAALWLDKEAAPLFTGQIAESSRGSFAIREERVKEGHPHRSFFPGELSQLRVRDFAHIGWLWPTLSVVSDSCAERVDLWMRDHWRTTYLLTLSRAMIDAAFASGLYPPHEVAVERLRAEGVDVSQIHPTMELRDPRIRLPEPTEEMCGLVSADVEDKRLAWLALAAESKRRLDALRSAIGSPPAAPPRP